MKTFSADRREKPCGGDFSLHQQDLTLQESKGNRHIFARPITASGALRKAVYKAYTNVLSVRLTDHRQLIALDEQHNRACEFGVKTVVLSACGKCVH